MELLKFLCGHFIRTMKSERGDIFGGGDSAVSQVKIPEFEKDKLYQQSQDTLLPFGSDLLAGKPNEYFSSIGETGSAEFEKMLNLTNRDITKSVDQGLAKRNIGRGGLSASISSKAIADSTTKLRWSDFVRSITGKEFLMSAGLNTVSGVRSGALTNQGQTNEFSLGKTKLELEKAAAVDAAESAEDAMWGDLLKAGIGAAAMIMTGGAAAPLDAAGGAELGSASASGMGSIGTLGTGQGWNFGG